MTNVNSVTNPKRIQILTRRQQTAKWRRSPRWKRMLAEHAHIPEAECAICHRKHGQEYTKDNGDIIIISLTINHTDRRDYVDEDKYLTWSDSKRVECTTCNWMYEKGMIPCPDCLKEGRVHYIRWDEGECWSCWIRKHPEEYTKIQKKREDAKQLVKELNAKRAADARANKVKHPCRYYTVLGKCQKSAIGIRCPYAKTKAEKMCEDFIKKVKVA